MKNASVPERFSFFKSSGMLSAALLAVSPSTVFAQPAANSAQALEVMVVTAQKRDESVQTIPLTVNVVDGNEFLDTGAGLTGGEITRFIPNASAATLDNHGFPRWFLRGIGTGQPSLDNVSPIGFYVDDVYLGAIILSGGPVYDLERVEVLPGPQGTLWGKNSPGGAIHVVNRKPVYENTGYIKGALANYDQRVLQGAINNELIDDQLASRFSFTTETRDLFAKNITKGIYGGLEDHSVRWQLLANPVDHLDVLFNVHHRTYKHNDTTSYIVFGPEGSVDSRGNPYVRYPDRHYAFNAPSDQTYKQTGSSLTLNYDLNDYLLTSITAWEKAENSGVSDGDSSPQEISRSYNNSEVDQWSQEIRLASPRQDQFNWITGIHWFKTDLSHYAASGSLDVPDLYPGTATAFSVSDWTGDTTSYAAFFSFTYNLTDRFNVTAGVRWSDEEKSIDSLRERARAPVSFNNLRQWWHRESVNNELTPFVTYENERRWRETTWDITPEYAWTDNFRTYLRVAKGFRGGGYIASPANQAGAGTFDPEFITSYEAGIKSEWLDNRIIFNGAAFYYDYEDIQINIFKWDAALNQSVSRMQNAASASVKGVEFQLQALLLDGLRLRTSVGLLDTEYKDYRDDIGNDYSGASFARAPKASAVIGLDYTLGLSSGDLVLGSDINARSNFHFSSTQVNDPRQHHSGYTLVNVRASWKFHRLPLQITAYVDNVGDKIYSQATSPQGPDVVGYALGAPRTYGLSAQYSW